ncbi:hypothetical protein HPT25_23545 [Bacillus sp. BRMEA1]|uniref:hypothetical protein n=1 Tax=Neobacillus endophyticus TaxID=2738405 RepID=UPI001565E71C|nr:hypothetical protein [Neobacillus endophyticus]NRD80300.1 hypothetical protein [Neobacillus endophyticus]
MGSWKQDHPKQLKKIVYALSEGNLKKVILDHESRGWAKASDVKEYNYGVGCLMIWNR